MTGGSLLPAAGVERRVTRKTAVYFPLSNYKTWGGKKISDGAVQRLDLKAGDLSPPFLMQKHHCKSVLSHVTGIVPWEKQCFCKAPSGLPLATGSDPDSPSYILARASRFRGLVRFVTHPCTRLPQETSSTPDLMLWMNYTMLWRIPAIIHAWLGRRKTMPALWWAWSFQFSALSSLYLPFFISHLLPILISVVLYLRPVSPTLPRRWKTAPNDRQLPAFINPARSTHWSSDPVQFTTSLPHWKESTL